MHLLLISAFVLGYLAIAFEHPIKVDKAASALLTGIICWVILVIGKSTFLGETGSSEFISESVLHHVGEIAEILFFLLAAMTIVELVDSHEGFRVITSRITTINRVKLMWIICLLTFFFSAALDNLTTAIVMAALLKKLISDKKDLWFFGGMVIIAANAGGAWSPIGDVTTIMLWIGGQITAASIVWTVFLPSLVCMLVPLGVVSFTMKGDLKFVSDAKTDHLSDHSVSSFEQNLVFVLGVCGLLFVPIFKGITHLPPFMGMLLSLGVLWTVTELLHRKKKADHKNSLSVAGVLRKIDTTSVLFFLGILLAVASLQTAGILSTFANTLDANFSSFYVVNTLIGLLSALVDNVPLVAGAIGMYPMSTYPQDHSFWSLLAYCAGTGGSALIIGSAAGVAIMGIFKIDFIWYLKNISYLALLGYFAGVFTYILMGF